MQAALIHYYLISFKLERFISLYHNIEGNIQQAQAAQKHI
jgi:hypothetical protein